MAPKSRKAASCCVFSLFLLQESALALYPGREGKKMTSLNSAWAVERQWRGRRRVRPHWLLLKRGPTENQPPSYLVPAILSLHSVDDLF